MSDQEMREREWRERLERTVRSAQITAMAYDEHVPVFVMVECEYRAGGQMFTRRACEYWAPDTGPYRQIASVL